MQAFFYHDDDWFDYGTKSHIVVYDKQTYAESSILDVACPGLSIATRDESGNTYFSTWSISLASVKGERPAPCVAKVSPTHQVTTLQPMDWTGGRFVNNFRYIGNGRAVANVLHHELLGVSAPSQLTAEQLTTLETTGPHWKIWLLDLNAGSGVPVQGADAALGSGSQFAVLDGRTFVFVPYDDWGKTKVFELDAAGKATLRVDTVGDVFKWVKVR